MAIFGNNQTDITNSFNVAGNMRELAVQQDNQGKIMSDTINKFVAARDEMGQLQAQTGAILSSYGVDESGKPDPSAPKYVHDLFNSVNKEGGIANLSRTQMIAGLQYYDTGTKVEQQRNALDMERLKVKQIKKAMQDQDEIEKALQATEEARKKVSNKKIGTVKELVYDLTGREDVELDEGTRKKLEANMAEYHAAQQTTDPEERSKKVNEAMAKNFDLLRPFTNKGRKANVIQTEDGSGENDQMPAPKVETNKDFEEAINPYRKPATVKEEDKIKLARGEEFAGKLEGYISEEYKRWKSSTSGTTDQEVAKLNVETLKDELGRSIPTPEGLSSYFGEKGNKRGKEVSNNPEIQNFENKISESTDRISELERFLQKGKKNVENIGRMRITEDGKPIKERVEDNVNLTEKEKIQLKKQIIVEKAKIEKAKTGLTEKTNSLNKGLEKAKESITPYAPSKFTAEVGGGYQAREIEVQKELQKTMDEQVSDQYELARNYMMTTNGRIPASFTKQAYAASQGMVMPVSMDMGNGYSYMKVGGVEKLVENKPVGQQNMLSIPDQQRLHEAGNLGKAKDLNGLTANGFTFSGEINVNDINMANKVRTELLTNTRALQDVDRLIGIAENSSALDKALPAELTGYAQQIQNSIQAAKRTEVGGSGAWSEQDQLRIDKIITDPTSLRNIVFRDQCLGALKGFRERLTASLKDQGTAYGFKFTLGSVRDQSMSGYRAAVAGYMARGYSAQEARQAAMPYLNGNTQ